MKHPYDHNDGPDDGQDMPVSPQTAQDLLLLCSEVLALALHVYLHTQLCSTSLAVVEQLQVAATAIDTAQALQHRPQRVEG
jgi:hypothetical protein